MFWVMESKEDLLSGAFVLQVALGRLALEPLAVLSALCKSSAREILSLNLHPLQAHVPENELLKAAERSIMTAVAQVSAWRLPKVSQQSLSKSWQVQGSSQTSCATLQTWRLREERTPQSPWHVTSFPLCQSVPRRLPSCTGATEMPHSQEDLLGREAQSCSGAGRRRYQRDGQQHVAGSQPAVCGRPGTSQSPVAAASCPG